jgi:hypothetical protein
MAYVSKAAAAAAQSNTPKIVRKPTQLRHVFLVDIDDTGLFKEIAIVKEELDGTLYYIDIDALHSIDKSRLKKVVTSMHADKYQLWELLAQSQLSNGMNALDFFHYNCVKVKRPKGARNSTGSLASFSGAISDQMVGTEFGTNPSEAEIADGGMRR